MDIKTGVDIIEVKRVQEAIERQGNAFLQKVFTKNEIDYCSKKGKMMYQHYAARFAAKEAIFKAVSCKISPSEDDVLNKIEIINDESGKPIANLQKLNIGKIVSMDLSLSHLKDYALASFSVLFE